jgi:hypothetical protein
MYNNLISLKKFAAGFLMLLILPACGLLRADETPVVVVFPSPTPHVDIGPPDVGVDILETPFPELFADFPTPTSDTIFPPTPTHTPIIIIITATPEPTPFFPTPTSTVDVVLPVTGADLTDQQAQIPTWSFGIILAGIIVVTFGVFRLRR